MTSKERLLTLADEASLVLGVSRNEAIAYGLRLVVAMNPPADSDTRKPEAILDAAGELMSSRGSFTMDDLLDEVYGEAPIFSPHKVKIFAAKLLLASGYTRRQFRRGSRRPLLWFKHSLEET
tara:strand:- start:306 stop:671 length:366 start_codon:yes stop_codon:yes gene_type:complete